MMLVYINTKTRDEALDIGRQIVHDGLAAAVSIAPIDSIEQRQGETVVGSEWLLTAKTTDECFAALETRVRQMHSHHVPAIVGVVVDRVNSDYASWVFDNTQTPGGLT